MSTEIETPNLSVRVESEKAAVPSSEEPTVVVSTAPATVVEAKPNTGYNWWKILGALLFVLAAAVLGRWLWNEYIAAQAEPEATTVVTAPQPANGAANENGAAGATDGAAATAAATTAAAATTGPTQQQVGIRAADGVVSDGTVTVTSEARKPAIHSKTPEELADNTVPWWQREYAKLEGVVACDVGKYGPQPFPYDVKNDLYKSQAFNKWASTGECEKEHNLYTVAQMAPGDSASEIYARARPSGIALLNRGAIRDPEKMLPRAQPGDEKYRRFQVGASIADIQKHLPKTTDLMKMARRRPAGLSFQIPRERPPFYTEGINCERRARVPPRTANRDQLFCINPIDPSEYYDYRPHPLLDSVYADTGRVGGNELLTVSQPSAAGSAAAASATVVAQ